MTDNTQLKSTLESELSALRTELETIATYNAETGDWVAVPVSSDIRNADDNDNADGFEEWNERRALMAQLEVKFHNITIALNKFETGEFGICEICNEKVEPERLAINPAARTCKIHMERERELPL